jgi:hypothetical protein
VLNARLNSKRRKEKQEGLFLTVGYTSPWNRMWRPLGLRDVVAPTIF